MELLMLPTVLAFFVAGILFGRWILFPVDRAARHLELPTQFAISDLLALFFLFSLMTGLIHWIVPEEPPGLRWALDAYAWIACGLMWGKSVQALSRGGITRVAHRAIFLAFVLPVAYFGSLTLPPLLGLIVFPLCGLSGPTGENVTVLLVTLLGLSAAMFACGVFTRRMVAASEFAGETTGEPQSDVSPSDVSE